MWGRVEEDWKAETEVVLLGNIPVIPSTHPLPTQVSDFMLWPRLIQLSASESMVFKGPSLDRVECLFLRHNPGPNSLNPGGRRL